MRRNLRSVSLELDFYEMASLYICKHLLTQVKGCPKETPLDRFFSSIASKDEITQLVRSVRERIDSYILENNLNEAHIAGFTMKSDQWMMSSYIFSRLKEMNPDTIIVIGGLANESRARAFMQVFSDVDFAIWGEGEYPLVQLITTLEEGTALEKVPQLIYRDGATIQSSGKKAECVDLDSHPFADHSDYFDALKALSQITRIQCTVSIPIWGSRSCPWNKCRFCVLSEEYSYRARSPENIVEEVRFQVEKHDVSAFYFLDNELPGNKRRFRTLLKLLVALSADQTSHYAFCGEVSPVFIDPETAHCLHDASFSSVQIGFEAVADSLLEKVEKRHRFAHNIQALKLGRQHNLNLISLNVLRGIPTESPEDVLESCENLDFLRFLLTTYPLIPISLLLCKGSTFYEEMSKAEREAWKLNRSYLEIASTGLIPQSERFEFFGFFRESHHELWNDFEKKMESYIKENRSYTWTEYENCSLVEEKGPEFHRYVLDRDETDILVFCDLIKPFNRLEEEFDYLGKTRLIEILSRLKEAGLLYYDKDMHTIISILETYRRETVSSNSSPDSYDT
ncbi:MAG: radical SAM protein [Theionarchaea archaeon]|nr:radical SAM protein [Theionarchaea archaeon]